MEHRREERELRHLEHEIRRDEREHERYII